MEKNIFSNNYVTIDQKNNGLFEIYFKPYDPNGEEFEQYLEAMENVYLTNEKVVFIFDATDTKYLPSNLRIRQGEWLIEKENLLVEKCAGHIYIVPNMLVNLILKGIFLVKKTPVYYKIVSSMHRATEEAKFVMKYGNA